MARDKLIEKLISLFNQRRLILLGSLVVLVGVYLFLALQNIGAPFVHISEDTNGTNGVAAWNLVRLGVGELKLGLRTRWISEASDAFGKFYTHHPVGFIVPTLFLYKFFGVSEATTRLGPLIMIGLALAFFYLALEKIFKNYILAFISTLVLVILPGFIYYGKHLDMQAPSLALMLVSFSLFVFHHTAKRKLYFYLFLVSVFVGGFVGWFYYFMPASLWLFIAFFREGKGIMERKKYLVFIPILLGAALAGNLWHMYILNGATAFEGLRKSFLLRSSSISLTAWLSRIWWIVGQNITYPFFITGGLGFAYWLSRFKKWGSLALFAPLFIAPLLLLLVFRQWSTHPFGLIFFLPFFGVFSAVFLHALSKQAGSLGLIGAAVLFLVGARYSYLSLNSFYNENLIFSPKDVTALKELSSQVEDNQVCIGGNNLGLDYGGIIDWYLQKSASYPPACYEQDNTIGLVFNPILGEYYQEKARVFEENGFKLAGCIDVFCVMTKQ